MVENNSNVVESTEEKKMKRDEAIRDMKMYMANDWDLKEETPQYFLLERSTATFGKHIILYLLFGWITLFLPVVNIIYYFVAKKTKKIMKF